MQINHYILQKLGWIPSEREPLLCRSALLQITSVSPNIGIVDSSKSHGIEIIKLFVDIKSIFFVSASFTYTKNVKSWSNFKFSNFESVDSLKLITIFDFNSNIELFSLIKQNLSCNKTYKRLFQLNSLLNEKTS